MEAESMERVHPLEDWDFANLTYKHTQYMTHFFHHWTAKFIPQIPSRLIQRYCPPGGKVVDPFMGSGTSIVEAKLLRHPSCGLDINPLAIKIAQAKTRRIDFLLLDDFVDWLEYGRRSTDHGIPLLPGMGRDISLPEDPTLFPNSELWFRDDTARHIKCILEKISTFDPDTKNFIEVGLSDLLKGMSNARLDIAVPTLPRGDSYVDKKHYHVTVHNPSRQIDVFGRLAAQLRRMARALRQLLVIGRDTVCDIVLGDARQLSQHVDQASLVVTSPPYWDAQNYQKLHFLSFKVLGLPEPGSQEIGRIKRHYLEDMDRVVGEIARVLDGVFAIVIGESRRGTHEKVRQLALEHGMTEVQTIRRRITNHAFFARGVQTEYIYVFRH